MSTLQKKLQKILKDKKGKVSEEKRQILSGEQRFVNRFLTILAREVKKHPNQRFFHIELKEDDSILNLYNSKEAEMLLRKHANHKKASYYGSKNYNNLVTVDLRA